MTKSEIRAVILKKRGLIGPGQRAAKDSAIKERLLGMDVFKTAKTVVLYASFKSEADTHALIEGRLKAGVRVILPRVEGEELGLYEITSMDRDLRPGMMGIPEPAGDVRGADINEADIIIVPGVAFDLAGGRLGYGKGYYDRLLALRRGNIPLAALAYEEQIWEGPLPLSPHDINMDCVVTEKRTIFNGTACAEG
ncbi:MAG: 5-formyltetrahydrofolate cyclo-ligase [Nitrospiraceae bacterium]|nr:5-formyltetrahydrofolate cyclo-ligase [Nitrospiraceae bacterium]MDA8090958.1 5-formyltetrahydrofolate cyclo-ligase [Nitrospiraceae bacterium]